VVGLLALGLVIYLTTARKVKFGGSRTQLSQDHEDAARLYVSQKNREATGNYMERASLILKRAEELDVQGKHYRAKAIVNDIF
jgi:hypothetical protein